MSSRDAILGAVRANKPPARPRPDVPLFDEGRGDNLVDRFKIAFVAMGGAWVEPPVGDPISAIRDRLADARVVISRVPEVSGTCDLDLSTPPAQLADVDLAIVRAAFGVAETGSVALTENELGINTLGYLAQHLIVFLDPADIVVNLHHAYQRPEFRTARYTVFHTGPSATADIEGVLIRGAQGVRSLSIVPLVRSHPS